MSVTRSRGRPPYADSLTPAEWRVADAIRHGGTDRTISKRLGISSGAVKFHVGNILGKLGFANRRVLRQWAGVPQASALGRRKQRGDDMASAAEVLERNDVRWGTIGQLARSHMIHRYADGTEEWMAFFGDNEGRPLGIMCQVPPA